MAFSDESPKCFTPKAKKEIILKEYKDIVDIDLKIRDKLQNILDVISRDIPFTSCKIEVIRDKLFINLRLDSNYVLIIKIESYGDFVNIKIESTSVFCFQQEYEEMTVDQFNKGLTFSYCGGEYNKFKD